MSHWKPVTIFAPPQTKTFTEHKILFCKRGALGIIMFDDVSVQIVEMFSIDKFYHLQSTDRFSATVKMQNRHLNVHSTLIETFRNCTESAFDPFLLQRMTNILHFYSSRKHFISKSIWRFAKEEGEFTSFYVAFKCILKCIKLNQRETS